MAEWKKVVVSGSNISELNNDSGFVASVGSGIVSGSSQISFTGITGVPSGLVSSSAQTVANLPAGTISGSSQVDYTGITNVPSGLVSGSAQILLGGDLSGTADSATVTAVQGVALTSGEATQLANIDSTTISSTQWGYLGVMDQNVRTTDSVTFATASVSQNLTVGGDLIVQGTTTELQVTNLNIEDQFILLNSGSTGADTGIVFGGADGSANEGAALYFDNDASRLTYIAAGIAAMAVTADHTTGGYVTIAYDVDTAGQLPVDAVGNIKIDGGEPFIYV